MPKYAILEENPQTLGGVQGTVYTVQLCTDLTEEQAAKLPPVVYFELDENGKEITKSRIRTVADTYETQKYFVPDSEDKEKVLSLAAHNHQDGLEAQLEKLTPKKEVKLKYVNALSKESLK
jgi:ATP-dependent protease Clp ATPase subunit